MKDRKDKIKIKNTSSIKSSSMKWVVTIIFISFFLSIFMNLLSSGLMPMAQVWVAFVILLLLVLTGILFDVAGVAVATATETPFHSMAAGKVRAATEAIWLIRNAEKVSNICNDVVGDSVGIISGAASAVIVTKIAGAYNIEELMLSLLLTGFVASLTIGGKAFGKGFAIAYSNSIIYFVARVICFFTPFRRKSKAPSRNHR